MFGPLMHAVKSLEGQSIIPGHCTGTVKRKLIKLNCSDIGQFLRAPAGPGRAGPVFRLDRRIAPCMLGQLFEVGLGPSGLIQK